MTTVSGPGCKWRSCRELLGVRKPLADVAVVLRTQHDSTRAGADQEEADAVALADGGPDEGAAAGPGASAGAQAPWLRWPLLARVQDGMTNRNVDAARPPSPTR